MVSLVMARFDAPAPMQVLDAKPQDRLPPIFSQHTPSRGSTAGLPRAEAYGAAYQAEEPSSIKPYGVKECP